MKFNPDPSKQAQEVIFTRKVKKVVHPLIFFNNNSVQQVSSQKHLDFILDTSLTSDEDIIAITSKVSKAISLLRKLNDCLPLPSLATIFKSFARPHLDYDDAIFEKAYNYSFRQRLESFQYKALLIMKGTIKSSSNKKLCQELGLKFFKKK